MEKQLLEFALLVLSFSIIILFASEFAGLFRRVFTFPGFKLLVPLFTASVLVVVYEEWVNWGLWQTKRLMFHLCLALTEVLPFHQGAFFLVNIVLLMGLSFIPFAAYTTWSNRKNLPTLHYSTLITGMVWLVVAILLINYNN